MNKDPNVEKQIDEMAKVICHAPTCEIRKNGGTCYKYCKSYIYAFRAINAGYCKTADVAREIFDEIESCKWSETQYGDQMLCFEINYEKYAELKKKYESEKINEN